jgi:hypothetical protein
VRDGVGLLLKGTVLVPINLPCLEKGIAILFVLFRRLPLKNGVLGFIRLRLTKRLAGILDSIS